MCYEYTINLYSKGKSHSCEKDETTSVTLKLDTVKEVRWATKYQSDLPEIFRYDVLSNKLSFINE